MSLYCFNTFPCVALLTLQKNLRSFNQCIFFTYYLLENKSNPELLSLMRSLDYPNPNRVLAVYFGHPYRCFRESPLSIHLRAWDDVVPDTSKLSYFASDDCLSTSAVQSPIIRRRWQTRPMHRTERRPFPHRSRTSRCCPWWCSGRQPVRNCCSWKWLELDVTKVRRYRTILRWKTLRHMRTPFDEA